MSQSKGISTSRKRATIMFNLPDEGRVTVQELANCPESVMRVAITAARQTFFDIYHGKRAAPSPSGQERLDGPKV